MIRRDWFSRWGALVLTAVFALSCGGGGSPSSPTPPSTLPAQPTPPPTGGGGVGASCPLGKGTVVTQCARGKTPTLLNDVSTAIELLAQQNPKVLNVNDQAIPGSGQYRILDQRGLIEGVAANLRAAGFCAQADYDYPLEVINVKNSQDVSEDYDLVLSSGYVRRGAGSYRQSCSPAAFPVDPDPSWPPSGSGCGKPYPPPISRFNSKIHLWGPDYVTLDSTAIVGPNLEYCALIGYTDGRDQCPVRVTGDPERVPCEQWAVGKAKDTGRYGPTWTLNGEYCKGLAVNGCENHPEDQYGLLAAKGGTYVMCGQNGACGQVQVDR
jgi:hypothetical protein